MNDDESTESRRVEWSMCRLDQLMRRQRARSRQCLTWFLTQLPCVAILLRHKLQAKLQGLTCFAITKSRNIFVARRIARSRIRFYFSQRLPQCCNAFPAIAQCNISHRNSLFKNRSQPRLR